MSTDAEAIAQLVAAGAEAAAPHAVQHYLYMSSKESAALLAAELRNCGFKTEERAAALGNGWLVLACHDIVLSEALLASIRQTFGSLIKRFGDGEYDGWEAAVDPRRGQVTPG